MSFEELGLSPSVLKGILKAGYANPTPIQRQAIPIILRGQDVLGGAQTGTGKTASFALPMLDILAAGRARARMPRSLVIEPTRELAAQVAESFRLYGAYERLSIALLVGGTSFSDQEAVLDRGADVLIATPGRLLDHFERGKLLLSDIRILVIDEVDRMLDMGFIPDVEKIVHLLPRSRQTLMFSATILPEIQRLADSFLVAAKEISVAPPATPVEQVMQSLVVVHSGDKRTVLLTLLREEKVQNALIFCNRKKDVDLVSRSLVRHGFSAAALHGDLSQALRTDTLERFKRRDISLLVASDVAARGLNIDALACVVNFDVPTNPEDYVHRIGRTARAGLSGSAYTLATPEEEEHVAAIASLIGHDIPRVKISGVDAPSTDKDEGISIEDKTYKGRSFKRNASSRRKPRGKSQPQVSEEPIGMGAHVPAFMLKEVVPKSKKTKKR